MENSLYIVTIYGLNNIILDSFLIVGSNDLKIHSRLDKFINECNEYNAYEMFVSGYSFSKRDFIDGYKIEII